MKVASALWIAPVAMAHSSRTLPRPGVVLPPRPSARGVDRPELPLPSLRQMDRGSTGHSAHQAATTPGRLKESPTGTSAPPYIDYRRDFFGSPLPYFRPSDSQHWAGNGSRS